MPMPSPPEREQRNAGDSLACKCFRKSVCFSKKTRYICRSRRKQSPSLMQHSETHRKRAQSDIDFQHITSALKTRLVWSEKKASSECKEALFEGQRRLVCKTGDWCMPHTPPTDGGKSLGCRRRKPTSAAERHSNFRTSESPVKQRNKKPHKRNEYRRYPQKAPH